MIFRKVTAILRPDRLKEVEDKLRSLGVPGISVTRVKGFGEYANFYKADWLCTHVRIEVFTSKHKADAVAEAIMEAAQQAPDDRRGTASGFFNLLSGLTMLIASVLAGLLWDRIGPSYTF